MCFPDVGDNCIIMQLILLILSALCYFPRYQRNGTEGENRWQDCGILHISTVHNRIFYVDLLTVV